MRPIEAAVGLFISQGHLQLGLTILRSEYLITIYEGRKVPRGHSATQTPQTSEDDCRCSYKEQARGGAQLVPMRMHLDNYSFRNLFCTAFFNKARFIPPYDKMLVSTLIIPFLMKQSGTKSFNLSFCLEYSLLTSGKIKTSKMNDFQTGIFRKECGERLIVDLVYIEQ